MKIKKNKKDMKNYVEISGHSNDEGLSGVFQVVCVDGVNLILHKNTPSNGETFQVKIKDIDYVCDVAGQLIKYSPVNVEGTLYGFPEYVIKYWQEKLKGDRSAMIEYAKKVGKIVNFQEIK